jgi:hypothetical protein
MKNIQVHPYIRLNELNRWIDECDTNLRNQPCFRELVNRIHYIENILIKYPFCQDFSNSYRIRYNQLLSQQEMILLFQLDRCEAIINNLNSEIPTYQSKILDQTLYPSFSLSCVQYIIQKVLALKARLKNSDKLYYNGNLIHLIYLKLPHRLIRGISRLLT